MAPPKKEAGSLSRPLPADLAAINNSPAASKSSKGSSLTKSGTSVMKSNRAKVSPDKVAKTPDKSKEPFRFRWMKKLKSSNGSTSKQDENDANAIQESKGSRSKTSSNGKSTKKARGSANLTKFENLMDFNAAATAHPARSGPPKTPRKFLFGTKPTHTNSEDTSMKDTVDSSDEEQYISDEYECYDEEEEEGGSEKPPRYAIPLDWVPPADEHGLIGPDHPSVPKSLNNMEKARKKTQGPVDQNGRHHGRGLVQWHRARMMEKLILFLQYECHIADIPIPWDRIVHRLRPGSSGPAATQMINKLRDILIVEGHMIPPPLGKTNVPRDPTIRALVRDFSSQDPEKIRVVRWDEKVEHRKESYQEPGVIRGSGNYVRASDGRRSTTGNNKKRPKMKLPDEYLKSQKEAKMGVQKNSQRKRREKGKRSKGNLEERDELADPADLPSDEEWNPKVTKKAKNSRRPRKSAVKVEPQSDGGAADFNSAPSMMRFGSNDATVSKHRSLPIKLPISPEKLAKWPAGSFGTPVSETQTMQIDSTVDYEDDATEADIQYAEDDEAYEEVDEDYEEPAEDGVHQEELQFVSPNSLFKKHFGELPDISYRGLFEHGTLDEYSAAIKAGTDPKLNGQKYKKSSSFITSNLASPLVHMTYAESVALAQANSQPSNLLSAADALFTNANSFAAAGIHLPVPMHLNSQFGALGLDSDDPFEDHPVHTPQYAPQPYDMAEQIAKNHTPPYPTFGSQISSFGSDHASSAQQLDSLRRAVYEKIYGCSDMNSHDPYETQGPGNSLPTSSGSTEYESDFNKAPGRILEGSEEHAGQSTEMVDYGDGWNTGNPSQMDAHMGYEEHGYESDHHYEDNDEYGHLSPGYVDYDDQASYGGATYHQ